MDKNHVVVARPITKQNTQKENTSPFKQKKYRPHHDDEEEPESSSPVRWKIKRDPRVE